MQRFWLAALLIVLGSSSAGAQVLGGYLTAGAGSIDYLVYRSYVPQVSGGVLWSFPGDWLRIGAEADVMTSNGYIGGKGGPLAELGFVTAGAVRPFARGGYFFGEDDAVIVGAGVDLWFNRTAGVRLFVQDAVHRSKYASFDGGPRRIFHEPSLQAGFVFRKRP